MTHHRIVTEPTKAGGALSTTGVPVPVHDVLTQLAATIPESVADRLPGLDADDIKAALEYAAAAVREQVRQSDKEQTLVEGAASALDLKKILVVDDIKENLLLIELILRGSGYALSTASNFEEALAKAHAELPILIISDIHMPGTSGLELLKELKADERTSNIAVILVTAHHRTSDQVSQGLSMGADDYIYRPFMRNEFLSRVEAVLRVKLAEAEAQRQTRVVAQRNKGLEWVNELALAVNSSLDLQEIFASSMQKLSQLLEAEAVSLLLLNEEKQDLAVNISWGTGERISVPFDLSSVQEPFDWIIQEQVPAIVANILNDHRVDLDITSTVEVDKIQAIPMRSKEQLIGAIAIVNKRKGPLDDADWVLLHSAAGIIAVAVENARLLESAQQLVDDLIALNEIGRALTSTLDLEQILKQTTLLIQRAFQAEAASLWLLDEADQELVLTASSGVGADVVVGFRLPTISSGIAGYVARTGDSYISADVSQDEKHFEHVSNLIDYQPKSLLSVPVQVKGQIIGLLQALHQKANWFDLDHLRLSYPVANFVGIAVENARLFGEVQDFSHHLEQMVAERTSQLAAEKEKTEAILASMADGLLVLDTENRVLTANAVAEHMLDFRVSRSVGQSIGPEQLENPLWRCISDITGSDEPTVNLTVDVPADQIGTVLSIQAHSAKVRNETNQVIGTAIVLRDITALKEVERLKIRFMAGVTHELKTPLSIIQLHTNNLLAYYDRLPKPKRFELVNSILDQAKLLGQLIGDVLELSRLDADGTNANRKPLDLVELVDQIVTDLRPLAKAKGLILDWQQPAEAVTILASSGQLEQVVRNLIDNGIKYTPSGGSVKVQTLSELDDGQTFAKIRVTDSGIGIPPEHQRRVFERFHRVDPAHTVPGTGLGLSIVKEIVNVHGGTVELESTPGAGSTFVVTLPGPEASRKALSEGD